MEEVVVTKRVLEIKKKKDSDGGDVFEVSRRHFGKAGTFKTDGSTGGVYSSWETVLEKVNDLNLPPRLLNGAKQLLDSAGFATIDLPLD
jgi:hypothetical protein